MPVTFSADVFQEAVAHVAKPNGSRQTDATKLALYALYKQATLGDCTGDAPSFFNVVARSKFDAWDKLRGMTREQAMDAYVNKVLEVDSSFKPRAAAAKPPSVSVVAAAAPASVASTPVNSTPTTTPLLRKPSSGSSSAVVAVASPARPAPPRVPQNPMLKLAMYAFLGLIPLGLGVFMINTFSLPALAGLGIVGLGFLGLVSAALQVFENSGLIAFLPPFVVNILLDWTLIEFILSDNLLKGVKEFIVQLMPILISNGDEATILRALSHMKPGTRRTLTQRGIVNLFSPRLQAILLPKRLREQMVNEPPRYRLSKNESDPTKLADLLRDDSAERPSTPKRRDGHAEGEGESDEGARLLDLQSSRELFRELFTDLVSRKNVEYILYWIDPNYVRTAAAALSLSTMFQLAVSSRARETLRALLSTAVLLGSLGGAAGCAGLFLLWLAAKKRKKQMGWE